MLVTLHQKIFGMALSTVLMIVSRPNVDSLLPMNEVWYASVCLWIFFLIKVIIHEET